MTRSQYSSDAARWINQSRMELGLSQAALADAIGVTQGAVAKWERGTRVLSAQSKDQLTALFRKLKAERRVQR